MPGLSVRALRSKLCQPYILNSGLDTLTIVCLTATTFEPFCVSYVGLSDIYVTMILCDFRLFPALHFGVT